MSIIVIVKNKQQHDPTASTRRSSDGQTPDHKSKKEGFTMNNTYLTLRKCAYIFDSTYTTYFCGTAQQIQRRHAIQSALREFYNNPEKTKEPIPCTINESGEITIDINGEPHRLNALQVKTISEPDNIINHRKMININEIAKETPHFHRFCKNDLKSNNFKSLQFEFFTSPEELGYIRVHFKNNYECFIIDERTGELYTSGKLGTHKPTTARAITKALEITSAKAKAEFNEVIKAITKTEV
jgi:hypothetical protein